jgi:hypothetical protein
MGWNEERLRVLREPVRVDKETPVEAICKAGAVYCSKTAGDRISLIVTVPLPNSTVTGAKAVLQWFEPCKSKLEHLSDMPQIAGQPLLLNIILLVTKQSARALRQSMSPL